MRDQVFARVCADHRRLAQADRNAHPSSIDRSDPAIRGIKHCYASGGNERLAGHLL